jgi:transaldolase
VNTLPPETFAAYRDHGRPEVRIRSGMAAVDSQMEALAKLGLDFRGVTRELEDEGVTKFAASYGAALAAIEQKASSLASAAR